MKITLDNSNNYFTTRKFILIVLVIFVYGICLELFVQPYSYLKCKNSVCTMYTRRGRFSENIFEYSFNRNDISGYKLQKHTHISSSGRYVSRKHVNYSILLILKNNRRIHLPYYFEKEAAYNFYNELKSNKIIDKFGGGYVYRFE